MNRLLLTIITILTFNFAFAQNAKTDFKIYPVDESKSDSSLSAFMHNLKIICKSKDTASLYKILDTAVVTSFGGAEYGKEVFIKHWSLTNPDSSDLWDFVIKLINIGGVFDTIIKPTYFNLPYANANSLLVPIFQENHIGLDPYGIMICLNKNVPLYSQPDTKSEILKYLSYDIVSFDYTETNKHNIFQDNLLTGEQWYCVSTFDSKQKGWVKSDNFYLEGGLKLTIIKNGNEWKINGLFPFD